MRTSQYLLATLREVPAEAETISHQLMLRAGLIRKLASGLYTWLPTGLRVLRKVEQIIREEMNRAGAQEVLMPLVQPAELWHETGRWQQFGPELLRIKDRHQRDFCLGPTHEEVITDLIRQQLHSYKQLPANFYQIQTKFRDEIRPRFGVMRAREFIMKDAYSFHSDKTSLEQTYQVMYEAYSRIFERLDLEFRAVLADTGSIGGSCSHEFHVLASSGEDAIAFSDQSDYAANVEMAEALAPATSDSSAQDTLKQVDTPGKHSIEEVAEFLKVAQKSVLKTLIVEADAEQNNNQELIALVLRGDHTLNKVKAEKIPGVKTPINFATDEKIKKILGCPTGSLGPINLPIRTIADRSAATENNFVCGANEDGKHLVNANWQRDASYDAIMDIREVIEGDPSPDGQGKLQIKRGIEVGHIFQLGQKYSESMNATVLDENGKSTVMTMGCYGIGVTRVVAAAIEQNYDKNGIIWPGSIAPFQIAIVAMNMHKSESVRNKAESLYQQLKATNIDVLLDDRNERPGVKFADMELIGIPHRIVIGEKSLDKGLIEYRARTDSENQFISETEIVRFLQNKLQ